MRERGEIENETMFFVATGSPTRLEMAILEVSLDIRDQNERIIALLAQDRTDEIRMGVGRTMLEVTKRARAIDKGEGE